MILWMIIKIHNKNINVGKEKKNYNKESDEIEYI